MQTVLIRAYRQSDVVWMIQIWNEVVLEGNAFPQTEVLDEASGAAFFAQQSYCGAWRRIQAAQFWACIFSTPIISGDAGISAMPVMRSARLRVEGGSARRWCGIALNRENGWDFVFCSSMPLYGPTAAPVRCMKSLDLSPLALFLRAFGLTMVPMRISCPIIARFDAVRKPTF